MTQTSHIEFTCLPPEPMPEKIGPLTRLNDEPWRKAYVYYARINDTEPPLYKIGVSTDFSDRMRSKMSAVAVWHHANRQSAIKHEQAVLRQHRQSLAPREMIPILPGRGKTEVFIGDALCLDRTHTDHNSSNEYLSL